MARSTQASRRTAQGTGTLICFSVAEAPAHMNALMKLRSLIAAVAMLLAMNGAAVAQMKCTVNDPTGTPLNVRSKPNGAILASLHNGAPVNLWELVYVRDKPWARVTTVGPGKSGWVLSQYLKCQPLYD